MDIISIFRDRANAMLRNIGINMEVEEAKENFGDFTLPCFSLAKEMKKNPALIAKDIAEKLKDEYFEKIEAVGPYVNFWIHTRKLAELTLQEILSGEIFKFQKREKVIVEHTSANPTGPLHVGRTRNSIIGDSLARVMRKYGYDVEVQYFVNDVGKQVATLLWGIKNIKIEEKDTRGDYRYVPYYQAAYRELEKNPKIEEEIQEIIWKYERGDEELRKMAEKYVGSVLKGIEESLKNINIHFDSFIWESSLVNRARDVADSLKDYLKEDDGAFYIDLKELGVEGKDRLYLFRRDGTTLYPLRDIAYHLLKGERARKNVDVLGEDHKLHFQAIKKIVEILNENIELDALFYSFVKLPEGKMSTRQGKVVYLDDLLKEAEARVNEIIKNREYEKEEMEKIRRAIAVGAIRFHILNVQEEKPMTFRWEDALNFEGESAPFIQYTHARAASILRKTNWNGEYSIDYISHPQEIKLLKLMAKYPSMVENAVRRLSPYIMARYAYTLASQFNQFYRDCPVLKADDNTRNTRLAIVKAFKKLIKDVLELLGIEAPEKM
ncbi:arginine--tRNA ligase [Candidatus Aciduliprofundum boonei]|uniref:Arginine--tRNA ligase n=1 Tax=Aciduliprofundum boonei (strain DSM 19572 / T469) TaxID=439481 RepID=B5I9Z5_ACIB4|nr:arginine--tRNA ligase [Candidatus Aciduliprofundum boonei]ADD08373.1 arginyl-tRNA synthetase [Aciduliprofundum boonei T469]EDY36754.1 arginyl-tRNA synthetase [Aciduliprofundum boonei T469]HII55711.1 arginine--tRNA ligase [Candidatus Aciduliprofundum boonei]